MTGSITFKLFLLSFLFSCQTPRTFIPAGHVHAKHKNFQVGDTLQICYPDSFPTSSIKWVVRKKDGFYSLQLLQGASILGDGILDLQGGLIIYNYGLEHENCCIILLDTLRIIE